MHIVRYEYILVLICSKHLHRVVPTGKVEGEGECFKSVRTKRTYTCVLFLYAWSTFEMRFRILFYFFLTPNKAYYTAGCEVASG